tara:strand:- start:809 stop:1006 length:198 start_codon:yes stop_codon:yes gene_type:complete
MTKCEHEMTKQQKAERAERAERAVAAWLLDTTCDVCIDQQLDKVQQKYDRLLQAADESLAKRGLK